MILNFQFKGQDQMLEYQVKVKVDLSVDKKWKLVRNNILVYS